MMMLRQFMIVGNCLLLLLLISQNKLTIGVLADTVKQQTTELKLPGSANSAYRQHATDQNWLERMILTEEILKYERLFESNNSAEPTTEDEYARMALVGPLENNNNSSNNQTKLVVREKCKRQHKSGDKKASRKCRALNKYLPVALKGYYSEYSTGTYSRDDEEQLFEHCDSSSIVFIRTPQKCLDYWEWRAEKYNLTSGGKFGEFHERMRFKCLVMKFDQGDCGKYQTKNNTNSSITADEAKRIQKQEVRLFWKCEPIEPRPFVSALTPPKECHRYWEWRAIKYNIFAGPLLNDSMRFLCDTMKYKDRICDDWFAKNAPTTETPSTTDLRPTHPQPHPQPHPIEDELNRLRRLCEHQKMKMWLLQSRECKQYWLHKKRILWERKFG